jgi:hypothetical protein
MSSFTSTKIKQLRLAAKVQSRTTGVALHEALDNVAKAQGFSNWSLLMKNAGPTEMAAVSVFKFLRSDEEMQVSMRNLPESFERTPGKNASPTVNVPDIWREFSSARNAVDFAIDYVTTLLKVPRFQVGIRSQVYWEMRLWLPYVVTDANSTLHMLANRHYKPVGMDTTEHVDYAKYNALHLKIGESEIDAISHRPTGVGYLYGDNPWGSRRAATMYLKRLHVLKGFLG